MLPQNLSLILMGIKKMDSIFLITYNGFQPKIKCANTYATQCKYIGTYFCLILALIFPSVLGCVSYVILIIRNPFVIISLMFCFDGIVLSIIICISLSFSLKSLPQKRWYKPPYSLFS